MFGDLSYITKVEIIVIVAILIFVAYLFYSLDLFKGSR